MLHKTSKIFFLVAVVALTAFIVFASFQAIRILSGQKDQPVNLSGEMAASQVAGERIVDHGPVDCDCETEFKNPQAVSLEGAVIATFVSGADFGFRSDELVDGRQLFYVIGQGDDFSNWDGKRLKISGSLVGITCAYAQTIFGECATELLPEKITVIE